MKRTAILFVVAFIGSSLLYASQKQSPKVRAVKEHNGWLKARDYLDLTPEYQSLYVVGLLDGWYTAPAFRAPENDTYLIGIATCVEGMKASQVTAIIDKYIRERPEHWDWDAKDQGLSAMADACRKRGFINP
jgi:hypothetical protein